MTSVTSRFLDLLRRNLKSDAVPRPPREEPNSHEEVHQENPRTYENPEPTSEPEEIIIEDNDINTEYDSEVKGSKKNKKKSGFKNSKPKIENIDPNNLVTVNTQAAGNVINIVNSNGTHWGNNYVYHMGPKKSHRNVDDDPEDEVIQKDDLILLVMEAKEDAEHEYIDFVSKNLGKKWRSFFTSLGYTRGRIETFEYDEMKNGVSEVRYKLLLDYVRNADDPSVGNLSTRLWEEGEREVVKGLSLIYKKNKKKL